MRPDERAIEVEPGDYILTAPAADNAVVDPSRNFTVRVAVGPRVCALVPANIPDPQFPDMTNKPDNPDLFQVGVTFQPDPSELGQFSLMSFNAFLSPPFTDLFEFTWELDGQVIAGETGRDDPEAVRRAAQDAAGPAYRQADCERRARSTRILPRPGSTSCRSTAAPGRSSASSAASPDGRRSRLGRERRRIATDLRCRTDCSRGDSLDRARAPQSIHTVSVALGQFAQGVPG